MVGCYRKSVVCNGLGAYALLADPSPLQSALFSFVASRTQSDDTARWASDVTSQQGHKIRYVPVPTRFGAPELELGIREAAKSSGERLRCILNNSLHGILGAAGIIVVSETGHLTLRLTDDERNDMEYAISDKVRAWAKAENYDVEMYLDLFNDYLANRRQKPYKDLDAAYRQCVRCDWGNLRRNQRLQERFAKPAAPQQSRILKTVNGPMAWENGQWIFAND